MVQDSSVSLNGKSTLPLPPLSPPPSHTHDQTIGGESFNWMPRSLKTQFQCHSLSSLGIPHLSTPFLLHSSGVKQAYSYSMGTFYLYNSNHTNSAIRRFLKNRKREHKKKNHTHTKN